MHKLSFVTINKITPKEEQLLTDLWNIAGGKDDNTINASHLLVLLAGLQKLEVKEILKQPTEQESLFYRNHGIIWINVNSGQIFFESS